VELAPSEIVVIHPLRFVDPVAGRRPVVPRKAELERLVLVTATVACLDRQNIEIELAKRSMLGFLSRGTQRLWVQATPTARSWPSESLESRLCSVAQCDPGGISLLLAFRRLLGDRIRRSAISVVEAGLHARGFVDLDRLRDPEAAAATAQMLADFRESQPQRWAQLQAMADRVLRPGLGAPSSAKPVPARPPAARQRDYLSGWKRLNPRPPGVRPPKKPRFDD
jgi:hypothetical protein